MKFIRLLSLTFIYLCHFDCFATDSSSQLIITPHILENFDAVREEKMLRILEILEKEVLNSEEFKKRILNHQHNGKFTFVENEGLSNQEVYEFIMQGRENLGYGEDFKMDLYLRLYYKDDTAIGHTYPNSRIIWIKSKFFDKLPTYKIAANIVHEWLHQLGFSHWRRYERPFSVPYGVGSIVKQMLKRAYSGI